MSDEPTLTMIVMMDTSNLDVAEQEIGVPCEQMITPISRLRLRRPGSHWCADNGAFSKFNARGFLSLLARNSEHRGSCRWVAAPDVVASARRTRECWDYWKKQLSDWPLAYVCQDGQEDINIPWEECSAIFVGGTTQWKLSDHAIQCIRAGQIMGKWVHVGRVNTPGRYEYFDALGVDSIDGSGLAKYSHMRHAIYDDHRSPKLL